MAASRDPGHLPLPGEGAVARSRLPRAALTAGQTLPADRLYAIENGPSGFDPAAPAYFPKQRFLMLMRNERLAALRTDFDEASHTLTIRHEGREAARGDLRTAEGRAGDRGLLPPLHAPTNCAGRRRCCTATATASPTSPRRSCRSSISPRSRRSRTPSGAPVDPLRFRANLYVAGWPAWREFDLLGRELAIGGARLKVVKRIVRCAATNVDPRHRHPRPADPAAR